MEKEKVWLRPVEKGDFQFCAELIRKELGKKPYKEKWSVDTARRGVEAQAKQSPGICFIIVQGKRPAGLVFGLESYWDPEGKEYFIEEIIIGQEWQGKGIGKKAFALLEKELERKGFKAIALLSHPKSKAFEFYRKLKFKKSKYAYLYKKV